MTPYCRHCSIFGHTSESCVPTYANTVRNNNSLPKPTPVQENKEKTVEKKKTKKRKQTSQKDNTQTDTDTVTFAQERKLQFTCSTAVLLYYLSYNTLTYF